MNNMVAYTVIILTLLVGLFGGICMVAYGLYELWKSHQEKEDPPDDMA